MGSVGIYVHSADITRTVVEKYLAENTGTRIEVVNTSVLGDTMLLKISFG